MFRVQSKRPNLHLLGLTPHRLRVQFNDAFIQLMGVGRSNGEGPYDTGSDPPPACLTNWWGFVEENPTGMSNRSKASPEDAH